MLGKMEIRTPPGSRPRDGRHCDLCGCSQPAVRCDKCGCQIFCLSCDDMYHRHPKRRFHLRKAVDPAPPVAQARPVLPVKVAHLNTMSPGDPSKMPLPPPRKKKSLFGSFRRPSPSSDNSPPLPKKEYSWTNRLGSIKKFMSNRPLPPLPNPDDEDEEIHPTTNGQTNARDMSFIHKRSEERPPQLPARSPRPQDSPGGHFERDPRIPNAQAHFPGQVRNGIIESNHVNPSEENRWNNMLPNHNGPQAFGTMNRQHHRGFMPPGAPGYPGGMHQSSSATDLHNLHNPEALAGAGPQPPHYPHYPVNPHMPPHYPYPMYPQYPNYPQYFGNSFANLSNPPTTDGDFSDQSEATTRHLSKKHPFRKRAKRSQSVMMDRMAYPGQFFPFGPYPGYGPWGAPMPMETPPSPASSIRSLNRAGRTRRRKKVTSEDDDEEFSVSSSPLSRPKSSSSDRPSKDTQRAPLATQTTSSEEESEDEGDRRRNKLNTIQRRTSEPMRTSSSPAMERKRPPKMKKRSSSKQSDSEPQDVPQIQTERRSSKDSNTDQPAQQQTASPPSASSPTWECKHCTFINPISNKICQVCCKTASPRSETPLSANSRPSSSAVESNRKQSVDSEKSCSSPDKVPENEEDSSKKDKQEMAILNSALDEAEKEISRGLEELMKLKDDMDTSIPQEKSTSSSKVAKAESSENTKPVYKSSGKMRTSILDKLNINKPQSSKSSASTSTEVQTGQSIQTTDKIIEARRHSNSSTTSEAYNSPLAQSPDLENGFSKQKRDSSCQTQQDSLVDFLERKKAAEESYLGRPVNNFGFGYNDRMDMVTSPVPSMYDRYLGGGMGMMQRSHSRASLFTGRLNDLGPVDYGGPGFGYGGMPMYRSVSRSSLTGDYPDGRMSEFSNLRRPDYYLSMEELVERRRQDNIRAQGLELVRMIREAEQQGFTADDIQVALTHCGKQSPMDWLQDNWRNMVDSVVTLSTNYGNDKKENDIGLLSENEARDSLRLHKGNIWAAVTECVEGRQRKYLELSARGKFSRKDIVDALTSSDGDVEMAYAKLSKSTGKPFLMRIWGAGEGAQNQDGAQPVPDDMRDLPHRYLKDDVANSDYLSDDIWSEDGAEVDWEEDEDYEEERGDLEDLQTCHEDLYTSPQEMRTPESDKSDYCDACTLDDRNMSSPSDDIFFVIPEVKQEKKKGFLSKLAALRKNSKEQVEEIANLSAEDVAYEPISQAKSDAASLSSTSSTEQGKGSGALNALKNTFSAIKDSVTGGSKVDKKSACAQPEKRTIIVRAQLDHESLSTEAEDNGKLTSVKPLNDKSMSKQISLKENKDVDKKTCEVTKVETEVGKLNQDNEVKVQQESRIAETIEPKPNKSIPESSSKESDSKVKVENKKPPSLAERLKLAKKSYSSKTDVSSIPMRNDDCLPSTSKTYPNTSAVEEKPPSKDIIHGKGSQHESLTSDQISKEASPAVQHKEEKNNSEILILDSGKTIKQENFTSENSAFIQKHDIKRSGQSSPVPFQNVPQAGANQSFPKIPETICNEIQNKTGTKSSGNIAKKLNSEESDNLEKQKTKEENKRLKSKSITLKSISSDKNESNINLENNVISDIVGEAAKVDEIKSDRKYFETVKTDINLEKPSQNLTKNLQSELLLENNLGKTNKESLKPDSHDNDIVKDSVTDKSLENDSKFVDAKVEHAPAEVAGSSKEFANKNSLSQELSNQMPKSEIDTSLSSSTPITEKELVSSGSENKQVNILTNDVEEMSSIKTFPDRTSVINEYKDKNQVNAIEENQIAQHVTSQSLLDEEHRHISTIEKEASVNKMISNSPSVLLETAVQNIPETVDNDYRKAQSKENILETITSEPETSTEIKVLDQNDLIQNTESIAKNSYSAVSEHLDGSLQVSDLNQISMIENNVNSIIIQNSEPIPGSSQDILTYDATNLNESNNLNAGENKDSSTQSTTEDTKKTAKLKSSKTGKLKKAQFQDKDKDSQAENKSKNSIKSETPVKSVESTSSTSLENDSKAGSSSEAASFLKSVLPSTSSTSLENDSKAGSSSEAASFLKSVLPSTSSTSLENDSKAGSSSDAASFLKSVLPSPFKCKSLNENAVNKQHLNDKTDSKEMQNENQNSGEIKNLLFETDAKESSDQIETMTSNEKLQSSNTSPELKPTISNEKLQSSSTAPELKNTSSILTESKQDTKESSNQIETMISNEKLQSSSTAQELKPMISNEKMQSSSTTPELKNIPSISTESKQNMEISNEPQTAVASSDTTSLSTKLEESSIVSERDKSPIVIVETAQPSTSSQDVNETSEVKANQGLLNQTTENKDSSLNNVFASTSDPSSKVESNAVSSPDIPNISASGSSDEPKQIEESATTPVVSEHSEQHSQILDNTISDILPSADRNAFSSSSSQGFPQEASDKQSENSNSTSQTADSDDTDIQYSDDSRPSSVTPPSPVDALRSRFEGLSGGMSLRGPGRPQSPFRRMSFNSTKQVIAMERIRDTSADKPWFHKKTVEPIKVIIPKRSIKQQLEMERRVRKMVTDRKVRTYRKAEIVVQLMDMNFEEAEAILAASECSTLEQAISYLQQECQLCAGHFSVSQIVSMTHCEHRACRECIRAYFTVQIRDRTILDLLCPFCNEPDISDEDVAQDYFNHLDIMLKKLVDIEIHELFQRKLRDRVLMKDPNFRWCSQCSSGFIAMPNLKRLVCPDCNAVTCASCRRLWERDHQGISCEAFAALKDSSDPDAQAADLAKLLTEDGIDCPCCHFKYALAKGGCMHFRCIQCQHDFCSGCSRPFKMGQKCGVSEFCAKLGLHAHHPRNCLFYLRDKEPEDLQKLLDLSDVKYNRDPPDGMDLKGTCQVMEQKETADGMVDDYCGKEVEDGFAGLCRLHYVEYLGQLVNKHKVDPIQIFDNDDLELVLRRASIRLPPKRYRESDFQYREKLVNLIQEELPLDKMDGS